MTGLTPYKERVDAAFATWLRDGQSLNSMAAMATLLGCRHLEVAGGKLHYREPAQPGEQYEAIVRQTLLELLEMHDAQIDSNTVRREHSLLDGLLRNERWRGCLDTVAGANRLVVLVANSYGDRPDKVGFMGPSQKLCSAVDRELPAMLSAWCPSHTPVPTSKRELAVALFGEAWTALVFDADNPERMMVDVIAETQPRYLPGLVPAQAEYDEEPLPDLETRTAETSSMSETAH
jgi:hypothetical protein